MKLNNASILITGASRGLGRALALELGRAGARLALVARDEKPLSDVVALVRRDGGIAFGIPADVADKQAIHPILAQASELAGPIDVLINNASTLGPVPLRPLLDTDCEDLERALAVNLVGPFRLAKAALGSMLARGGEGLVVNISSDAAIEVYPTWGAYAASKAALDQLTRVWSVEFAGTPLGLISVDPGEMNTRMHAEAMPEADPSTLRDPALVAKEIISLIHSGTKGGRHAIRDMASRESARGTAALR